MLDKCPSCGADLLKDSEFCIKCGNKILNQPQQFSQQQTYSPMGPLQKISTKQLAIIAIAVVAIVIVMVLIFVMIGGSSSLVGKWRVQDPSGGNTMIWTVYSNNTVKQEYAYNGGTYAIWGYWELEGSQICGYWETDPSDYRCFELKFSDGGNRISCYYNNQLFFTGTRIG
jgi:hypothetical protein